ncbi:MAG: hypothetical protein AAF567_17425 [Actinomycetota bacterium]
MRAPRLLLALLVALALLASACGSSGSDADDAASGADDPASADVESAEADTAGAPVATEAPAEEPEPADEPEPAEESEPVEEPADEEPTPQPVLSSTEEERVDPVVFADDFGTSIQPILAEKCASCHGEVGPGSSHWRITSAQDAVDTHLLIRGVVESNYMPPWPASDNSISFKDNRDLRPDQVAAIIAWSESGGGIDVDPASPIVSSDPVLGLENPDRLITPAEPYAGDPSNVDDYRCQIYDPELPDGGWITGYEFIPDQTAVVHHAIGYVIEPDRADRAADRDGEDGRPGWECYGSSGLGGDDLFLGWAPGQDASVFEDGAGLYMPPGAFLVVQIHYHYEGSAPADASALALTLADTTDPNALDEVVVATLIAPAEIPCAEWESGPLCDRDAALADALERFGNEGVQTDRFNAVCGYEPEDFAQFNQGTAESACYIPAGAVDANGEVLAILGHMHEIGSWMRMTLNPGTPDEKVLLDIPNWDFDWQYNYVPADPLTIGPIDTVLLECGWDRARRDPSLEPAYILWADGTNDEMCFATITVRN